MRVILMAPPGGGKGTQAKQLSEKHDVPHVETGNILRRAVKEETEVGRRAKEYMDSGALVPDEVMIDIIRDRLSDPDCSDGFILDGFPRTLPQARELSSLFQEQDMGLDSVIYLNVPSEVIYNRLGKRRVCDDCGATYHLESDPPEVDEVCDSCGGELVQREDDTREAIEQRLEEYREKTRPVLEYYDERDLLTEVDGNRPIEKVTNSIDDLLAGAT